MARLKYLPHGITNIKERPKIYYCAHPRDYTQFLKPISDELWEMQKCPVWYLEDPNAARDEHFWDDLSQMQLLVMPVTEQLLKDESNAMAEFQFAMEKHIPILPLMQERGLEKLFNSRCGDLQFLDKTSQDNTAIPYKEKLEKYLSDVLIGDELAQRVRSAFDAYVFLSYRKKDRLYAQKLIQLIHCNDFFRDIAIWYDEFLTPGENFNDAIQLALKKCDLFAMAVTPNLVIEDNYIRQYEYPEARRSGKPILPVEMLSTNRIELEAQYVDIPACINGSNDAVLSAALLEHLRRLALPKKDKDPAHNYLIGLAYLGGIDVEVCYDRALELITSAADDGLYEAAAKLVDMYCSGQGVEYDLEKAYTWKQRCIALLEQNYKADPTEENLDALFQETMECALWWWEDHWAHSDPKRGKPFLEAAKTLVEPFAKTSTKMQRNLALVYCVQGKMFCYEDPESVWVFRKGMDIYEEYAKHVISAESKEELGEIFLMMGDVYWANQDADKARFYYMRSFEVREALALELRTAAALQNLSQSACLLMTACRAFEDCTAERAYCQRMIALAETLSGHFGKDEMNSELFSVYASVGSRYFSMRDYDAAREIWDKALATIDPWEEYSDQIEFCDRECMDYGNSFLSVKLFQHAEHFFTQGLTLAQTYSDVCNSVESYQEKLVSVYKASGDWERAKALCLRRIADCKEIGPEGNASGYYSWLALLCEECANVLELSGDVSGAKVYYEESYRAAETLTLEKGKALYMPNIFSLCNKAADFSRKTGDVASAKDYYRRCLAVVEQLYSLADQTVVEQPYRLVIPAMPNAKPKGITEPSTIPQERSSAPTLEWANCYIKLGNLFFESGDNKAAWDHYAKALTVLETLGRGRKDWTYLERLVECYRNMEAICKEEKDPAAEEYATRIASIEAELAHLPKILVPPAPVHLAPLRASKKD